MIAKGRLSGAFPIVTDVIEPVVEAIRQQDNLMANYAMKYFNMLAKHIVAMDSLLNRRARLAYVVGCSRLKDVFVETDVLLGQLLEGLGLGYRVTGIERIRRRHSGKDLHESIVYAERE